MARTSDKKLIPCKRSRLVTFSKRCTKIFEKANELCSLTGCEIGIVIFSECGRPNSFGHPSVESVAHKFMNKSQRPVAEPAGGSVTSRLNQEEFELRERLKAVKQRGKKLAEDRKMAQMPVWLNTSIHDLPFEQLTTAKDSLEKLKEDLEKRIAEISQRGSGQSSSMNANVPDLNFPPCDEM